MKLRTLKDHLLKALADMGGCVAQRATHPVLKCVQLDATEAGGYLWGCNLEVTGMTLFQAKVDEPGSICVEYKRLLAFVKTLPDEAITVRTTPQRLIVEVGSYKAQFPVVHPDEFPLAPDVVGESYCIPDFCQMVLAVSKAAAKKDNRPILTGVCLWPKDGFLYFVGADSYQAVITKTALDVAHRPLILPAKSLAMIAKAVGEGETVTVTIGETVNAVRFDIDGLIYWLQMLDGTYPDVFRLMLTDTPRASFTTPEMERAVKAAWAVGKNGDGIVELSSDGEGQIKVQASSVDGYVGEAIIEAPDCAAFRIGLNGNFLLGALDKETLSTFEWRGENSSMAIRRDNYYHLIMPMHIRPK